MKYIFIVILSILSFEGIAITAEARGLAIAKEMDKRNLGFADSEANMTMILKNRTGDTSTRQLRVKTLEIIGDGDKSMSIFDIPADIKGTAFLNYSHALKADDQWLYLPAIRRVKRISSRNKSGPFMGSEFAYEDLGSQEVEKYTYKFIKETTKVGRKTFIIERYPAYKYSGYLRQKSWIDVARHVPVFIEFYDKKKSLLKTLTFSGYKLYLDKYWRADHMHMINLQTGKETTLKWTNYKFQSGLTTRDFSRNALKRQR